MNRISYILLIIFVSMFYIEIEAQGGDTPAQALASPSTIPFTNVAGTTVGKVNNVTSTATGLPSAFPTSYISGLDYFYYVCPTISENITVTLNYTPTASNVDPCLLVWDGVPGVAGSTVVSSIYSSGDNSEVSGTIAVSLNVLNTKCYYIMVDNWPTPNGFAYTISAAATTIANGCTNIGFESNNFSDWSVDYGLIELGAVTAPTTTYIPQCSSTTMPAGVTAQHLITSAGTDPNVPIQMVCPLPGLGSHSLRLGDGAKGDQHGASIEQLFAVTSANAMFSYYYAVVMKYTSSHDVYEQPMFKISITDQDGNNIVCADYLVVASPTAPGFVSFSGGSGYYKDWTPVFVDLTNYIGTNVKIKYQVGDCSPVGGGGTHYCYAYIDGTCSSTTKTSTVTACSGVSTTLNAPMGGATYSWKVQGTATVLGTAATLTVVPTVTTVYECTITSVTNCVTTTTVTLNVTPSPVITNPGTQTVCDSYALPVITGTDLTGNQKYYNNSQALGGTQISGAITTTQTVWIYDVNGSCLDEESFLVKVRKTPVASVNSPLLCTAGSTNMTAAVTPVAVYSYVWTSPIGVSNPGDVSSFSTSTVGSYIVNVSNANLLCSNDFEDAITFTAGSFSKSVANASSPCWKSTGANVEFWKTNGAGITAYSGNQYIKVKGAGATTVYQNFTATANTEVTISFAHKRSAGAGSETMTVEIGPVGGPYVTLGTYTASTAAWTTYSVDYLIPSGAVSTYTLRFNSTVAAGASGNCLDAVSLSIIGCPALPATGIFTLSAISITNPGAQTVCDSYTLPVIAGTNLTGNQKYYNNSQALGGTVITGPITSTQTVWIYDSNGTCSDEESFLVTVNTTPVITNPGAQTVCDSYIFSVIAGINLSGNQKYYNNSQALGGTVITGPITTTQTVWIYDANGTCSDEESFIVTILNSPIITNPGVQTICDSYTLPVIAGSNLSGGQKYYNNSQALGGTQISGVLTSSQTVWIYDASGTCKDEESFIITINNTPVLTNPGAQTVCDSYTLPVIAGINLSGNQKYYNNSQALGGSVLVGPITTTQTVWIYDAVGTCKDEKSFVVTVNYTPNITNNISSAVICASYTLPVITGTNLSGGQKFYNNSQALGGTVITGPIVASQTIWIYDANGSCKDEESYVITINTIPPAITNPGAQTACDSYTLPVITGTNLTGNQKYYNNSQVLGGTVITGPITSSQTIWVYDAQGTCQDEISYPITILVSPQITNPGAQTVCDSYALPVIAGTNLSGNQKYYNNSQALGGTQISGVLTTSQTVWIYDNDGSCANEKSFLLTVNNTPVITNPGAQTVCGSYTLSAIGGLNISVNAKYYNNSQALGGTQISGNITSSQTVWIYDAVGTCKDEESFLVTVNITPNTNNPGNQIVCDTYTLPVITGSNLTGGQKYYNNSQALGGIQISGNITSTQTVWIYDAQGSCKDEKSFTVTVNVTPNTTNPGNQIVCDAYTLPVITGSNLTSGQKYYNNSQALGGTQISGNITSTQTVWIYDAQGSCKDEKSFIVTVNKTPVLNNPGNQTQCDSYSLPLITGINLTTQEKYYNNSQALGGTVISGPITSTQTIWIYDVVGTCKDEESFNVTINYTPVIDTPLDTTVCDTYVLPVITGDHLTGLEAYYSNNQATGGTLISGNLTSTQTVWIYDISGSCSFETSYLVTVNHTPSITNPGAQIVCDQYTLPTITGVNLTGNEKLYNNSQVSGGTVISAPITTTQTVWIYDEQGSCSDEESFLVTVNYTPNLTNPGSQTWCDQYALPVISGSHLSGNQKYYNNPQTLGGTIISGTITSTQTIWMYDNNGSCKDEKSFKITIDNTPNITSVLDQTVCDNYTLPIITGTNLTGAEKFYSNSQVLGGVAISGIISSSQRVWMYDEKGVCTDEKSFYITIHKTPSIVDLSDTTVCDSYTLPAITGLNLSANQKYYNNSHSLGGLAITGPITSSQTVWIYDENWMCSDEEQFNITINNTPNITNPGNVTVCDTYTLPTITGTNLSGHENFFTNSQVLGGTILTGPITDTTTIWLYDNNGMCSNEKSFVVSVNHTPDITNQLPITSCDTYTLPAITGLNLTGGQKYYTNSKALNGTVINGPITSTQTVWIYDTHGTCSDEKNFVVTINKTPILNNPGPQIVCDSFSLPAISGLNLSGSEKYYTNSQSLVGLPVSGNITSTQTIWIFDNNGACTDEESFLITVNYTPTILFTPDVKNGCIPLKVTFTNTTIPQSESVVWNFGDGTSIITSQDVNSVAHTYGYADCFNVTLTSTTKGCTNSLTMQNLICTFQKAVASFQIDKERASIINPVFEFQNNSLYADRYTWMFGDGSEGEEKNCTHKYEFEKANYQIVLIADNNHGCADTIFKEIEVFEELLFFIPNTFTPDGDDYNPEFKPIFTTGFDPLNFTMLIFDRWGEIVYETHDVEKGWKGTLGELEEKKCQDGVYIWKITYFNTILNENKTISGDVKLLR